MIDEKKLIEKIKYLLFNSEILSPRWFAINEVFEKIKRQPKTGEWTPCSERMPEDLTPVNITWTNHFTPDYYAHIKDVHFTYTGIFYKGKWYWWSAYAKDTLAEYGNDEVDEMADEIEVLAWQTLPELWRGEEK